MTIAAGFKFDGGIFLCADSQFSYGGVSKARGNKLLSMKCARLPIKLGCAIAGDVPRARTAIRKIFMAIDSLPAGSEARDVFTAIEEAVSIAYKPVFVHPLYRNGDPDYSVLMCLWMEGVGSTLLITHEDNVNEVQQYDCKGSGEYLFRYLIQDMYDADMALESLVTLVTFALQEIKTYDPNVGFNSEFLAFFNDKKTFSRIAGYDVGHLENFGSLTKREFFRYMFVMADLKKTKKEMSTARQSFQDNLTNLRNRYLEDKTNRQTIGRLMEYLKTAKKPKITIQIPLKQSASQK